MRKLIRGVACTIAVAFAACATGGAADPGQPVPQDAPGTPPVHVDGHTQATPDAPPAPHDASGVLPDAAVTPDAPGSGSGGQLCSDNTMCPDSGTCCLIAICVPGTGLGSNLCFPDTN